MNYKNYLLNFDVIKLILQSIKTFFSLVMSSVIGVTIFFTLFYFELYKNVIDILIYRGIAVSIVAAILHALLLVLFQYLKKINFEYIISSVCVSLSFNLCFLVICPVTVDRSITTFLLTEIEKSQDGLSKEELNSLLVNKYLNEKKAVDKRIYEQSITGNLSLEKDKYRLTKQGEFIMKLLEYIKIYFKIDNT